MCRLPASGSVSVAGPNEVARENAMKSTFKAWESRFLCLLLTVTVALLWPVALHATDGHFLHGAGPVNEAMGGADTGLCLDATGSIAWNPACAARFFGRRLEINGTLFFPWRSLSSTVQANAFGPGMPPMPLRGTT